MNNVNKADKMVSIKRLSSNQIYEFCNGLVSCMYWSSCCGKQESFMLWYHLCVFNWSFNWVLYYIKVSRDIIALLYTGISKCRSYGAELSNDILTGHQTKVSLNNADVKDTQSLMAAWICSARMVNLSGWSTGRRLINRLSRWSTGWPDA